MLSQIVIDAKIVDWVTVVIALGGLLFGIVALWQTSNANKFAKEANDLSKRIMDAQIEPSLIVDVAGKLESCIVSIENDAGCDLADISTSVSVGFENQDGPSPVRKCLFTDNWTSLPPGQSVKKSLPLHAAIGDADADAPEGYVVNTGDLAVQYSFVRAADRRRFAYSFPIGFMGNANGKQFVCRLREAEPIASMKRHILQRTSEKHEA